ncbi:MAG: methyltransferase domain-containing protein [Ignavibacteria bacterium]|nr:methyltransferase domain-containing protein [Ignavibacteria bacterium]
MEPAMKVLDLGCGIGGSSRLLSSEFGCNTIGIDITEEYCRAAAELSKLVYMRELNTGLEMRQNYRSIMIV